METNTEKLTSDADIIKNNVKLIDGIFDAEEAGKVLLTLTNSKINYHTLEMLSSKEIYGIENVYSKKRIDELRTANIEIAKTLRLARELGKKLRIDAVISIQYE
jgi:hypothetical protein